MAKPLVAVVDATPCISLHRLGIEEVLTHPFDRVYLPTVVCNELLAGVHLDHAYQVLSQPKVHVCQPASAPLPPNAELLDEGERAALRVARMVDADWIIVDEKHGRKVARSMGFRVIGSLGLTSRAYESLRFALQTGSTTRCSRSLAKPRCRHATRESHRSLLQGARPGSRATKRVRARRVAA